jgi:predicted Zn-dependent protease
MIKRSDMAFTGKRCAVAALKALLLAVLLHLPVYATANQSLQEEYEKARQLYVENELGEAKIILNNLLQKIKIREELVYSVIQFKSTGEKKQYKLEPAVLNILGDIYLAENDIKNATLTFTRMLELYPHDFIYGPFEYEGSLDGPAGAIVNKGS